MFHRKSANEGFFEKEVANKKMRYSFIGWDKSMRT
jgi:hypothetical protein